MHNILLNDFSKTVGFAYYMRVRDFHVITIPSIKAKREFVSSVSTPVKVVLARN